MGGKGCKRIKWISCERRMVWKKQPIEREKNGKEKPCHMSQSKSKKIGDIPVRNAKNVSDEIGGYYELF